MKTAVFYTTGNGQDSPIVSNSAPGMGIVMIDTETDPDKAERPRSAGRKRQLSAAGLLAIARGRA